jgi:HPt (histidine-containing phosphotransfer) domain-containing protein
LFLSLLEEFEREFASLVGGWCRGAVALETEETGRVLHAIKGLSGNLGARELHEVTRELERVWKEQGHLTQHPELLELFGKAFDGIGQAIALLRERAGSGFHRVGVGGDVESEAESLDRVMRELWRRVEINDVEVEASLAILRHGVQAEEARLLLAQLEERLRRFDFDGARPCLLALAGHLGVETAWSRHGSMTGPEGDHAPGGVWERAQKKRPISNRFGIE